MIVVSCLPWSLGDSPVKVLGEVARKANVIYVPKKNPRRPSNLVLVATNSSPLSNRDVDNGTKAAVGSATRAGMSSVSDSGGGSDVLPTVTTTAIPAMVPLASPVSAPVVHNVAGIQELNDSIQSLTAQLRTGE